MHVHFTIVSATGVLRSRVGTANPRVSVIMLGQPLDRLAQSHIEWGELELAPKKRQQFLV